MVQNLNGAMSNCGLRCTGSVDSPGRVQFIVLGPSNEFWVNPDLFQHRLKHKQSPIRTDTTVSEPVLGHFGTGSELGLTEAAALTGPHADPVPVQNPRNSLDQDP